MKHYRSITTVLIVALLAMLIATQVGAQVPEIMSYQGLATDNNTGNPLPDGNYPMAFSIYDAASAGSVQWGPESHSAVAVSGGVFSVTLGQGTTPIPLTAAAFAGPDRWLEIEINSQVIVPRTRLTTVPYAFKCASGAGDSDWEVIGNDVVTEHGASGFPSGGHVGIKTAIPQTPFHIGGDNTGLASFPIYIAPTGTNGITPLADPHRQGLLFNAYAKSSNDSYRRYVDIVSLGYANYTYGGSVIRFLTNDRTTMSGEADERMRIERDGNVGIGTTDPSSRLDVDGPVATALTTVTADYTITADNSVILGDNSLATGTITLVLPPASGCKGRQYTVKKISSTGNGAVVLQRDGFDLIDGTSVHDLNNQFDYIVVVSDGVDAWHIVGKGM